MLKRFQVKGFRSCTDVTLENLGSITALVGRNGSGKTNLLRAIEGLARTATSTESVLERRERVVELPGSMTADVEPDGVLYRYTFAPRLERPSPKEERAGDLLVLHESLAVRTDGQRWEKVLDRVGGQVRIPGRAAPINLGHLVSCLPALAALLPADDGLLRHVRPLLSFLAATRYYPVDETNVVSGGDAESVVSARNYRHWLAHSQATGDLGDSILMRLLYAYLERRPHFEEIQSLLGANGLDLIEKIQVTSFRLSGENKGNGRVSEDRRYYAVRFRPSRVLGRGPGLLEYSQLSLGTRRVLHILVSLIVDGSTLMLIEHPEDGIHSALLKKLMSLLGTYTNPAQIILTSHSADAFNMLAPPDVRLVTIHKGATHVRALTPKEVEAAARFIREEGSLADFLKSVREE